MKNGFLRFRSCIALCALATQAPLVLAVPASAAVMVNQTNLVSDQPGVAAMTDLDLVNPWGISFAPTSPFWVSDNGPGLATLYRGTGVKQGLVVTVPLRELCTNGTGIQFDHRFRPV